MGAFTTVAVHELKAGLSRYLAQVRAGEVIEITSHNKPVARLVSVLPPDASGLAGLLGRGGASWRGGKPSLRPVVDLSSTDRPLSALVLEERG
ncbi:MAG TPA: type II toxin-antitoxin system prevent-host-death family antitoxin [Ideonella sp.]|nr:type II toxin-antitoxin system prevent-host-death family antitoxin [Ideonella sp.]